MLEQRGQLLNGHLFRLVEGDAELFRQVRERLISDGIAEDRSGVGLALRRSAEAVTTTSSSVSRQLSTEEIVSVDHSERTSDRDQSDNDTDEAEWWDEPHWWLMSSGIVRGPLDLITLCSMRHKGEISPADVVRQGETGLWKHLDQIPLLAASVMRSPANVDQKRDEASKALRSDQLPATPFIPPEKAWSMEQTARPGLVRRGWHTLTGLVGGGKRLVGILFVLSTIVSIAWWWQQPPPSATIYREFSSCRAALKRLQDRRVGKAEWELVTDRYRPRIQSLVERLKSRANERHPIERSLYRAGSLGLIPMFESLMSYTTADREFEREMDTARKLLGNAVADLNK